MHLSRPPNCPRSLLIRSTASLSLLLACSAFAQAPQQTPPPTPAATAAARQAYSQLDWTGRPESAETIRREAYAARAEGRRACSSERRNAADRKACLQVVEADYRSMLTRVQERRARR